MEERRSVAIRIQGREFRVLGDGDEQSLHRVAELLDQTLAHVSQRTGTIDSLAVALLTGLNLAREVLELREATPEGDAQQLRELIELAESAVAQH